jgi:hypothetical protein
MEEPVTLTHALLLAAAQRSSQMDAAASHAAPPGVTVGVISGTDHYYSDGDTVGAIARIETKDSTVYVWPNGRIWNRDWSYPPEIVAWIKSCQNPDTKAAATATEADTKKTV